MDGGFLKGQRRLRRSDNLLLVFHESVADDNRDAVTLTTWAAERHADVVSLTGDGKQGHQEGLRGLQVDPEGWFQAFRGTLSKLGWQGDSSFRSSVIEGDDAETRPSELLEGEFSGERPSVRRELRKEVLAEAWPDERRLVGVVHESEGQPSLQGVLAIVTLAPRPVTAKDSNEDPPEKRLSVHRLSTTLNLFHFQQVKAPLLARLRAAEAEHTTTGSR